MARLLLICVLTLSVVCMVPLMGADHAASGHLHHGDSVSCATCMGPESIIGVVVLLTLLGLLTVMIPVTPLLAPLKDQFHPPRIL